MTTPADAAVAAARDLRPQSTGIAPSPMPARFSDAKRALLANHASEQRAMEIDQHNQRLDLVERQAAEIAQLDKNEAK